MSSLSIEMGLRRKRGDSPPVPDQIACRDDVTMAQKQRLAMLAKMGLGHVGGATPAPAIRDSPQQLPMREFRGVQSTDRKAALLEKERRFREQEERQQEQEAQEEQERRAKRARAHGAGISRLGPVQPREDDIPQFLPAPMQVPPPKPAKMDNKMEIKISKETADRAKGPQPEKPAEEDEEDEETKAEDQVLAFLRMEKAKRAKAAAQPVVAKPTKKKKKRKTKEDGDWQAWLGEQEEAGAEEHVEEHEPPPMPLPRVRDGGFSKQIMVVESVKGKVSTANRNMTDLDLERRFSMQESQGHGSLMTEEEVLRMIRKEKQERGSQAGSASRRVQRELAEWAAAKEQQRARVKSPHRFERMVVSRK